VIQNSPRASQEITKKLDEQSKPMLSASVLREKIKKAVEGYVKQGWAVIPLHSVANGVCSCGPNCKKPGKHPAVRWGADASTNDNLAPAEWWTRHPDANIGIRTGEAGGLVVLDVDIKNKGDETLKKLEATYGKLPETPTVRTGGGGWHYYFRYPGSKVRNSAGKIGPGLDIRGDGGYVVAPPSLHASGNRYEWLVGPDTPLAELPQWIIDGIQGDKPVSQEPTDSLGVIDEGQRNDTLTRIAGAMRRRGCSSQAIYAALSVVNVERCKPPLADDEVNKIANSMSRYGPASADDGSKLILTPLDAITPEKLQWLWPDRIPLGKITLLVGSPGLGKTFLTLDIAARVSTGKPWPDASDQPTTRGSVIILTAEDDMADTVVPRVMAAGGDRTRIFSLEACKEDGGYSPFSLSRDIAELSKLLDEHPDVRLLIIDPISAFLGRIDSHNNTDVRSVLAPLMKIAADHEVAVVCITHHNKGQNTTAAGKIMGSVAFEATARQVWHLMQDPDDPDRRLFVIGKQNLTKVKSGLAFRLVEHPEAENPFGTARVEFDSEPVLDTAEDIVAKEQKRARSPNKTDEAIAFLQRELAEGPREKGEIEAKAKAQGIAMGTLRRAKEALGVVSDQEGRGETRTAMWSVPRKLAA
jgi:hypothetical protein